MDNTNDKIIEDYLLESFRKIRGGDHAKGGHMLDDEFIISLNDDGEVDIAVLCYNDDPLNGKINHLYHDKLKVSDNFTYRDVTKFFNKNNIVEHDNYKGEVIALYYNELVRWVSQHA